MEPIRHLKNPRFSATIFRRTYPEVTNQGGLWDQSLRLYPHVQGSPKTGSLLWVFPSGARISFSHLVHDDTVLSYQGSEIPLICFDELTLFSARQFWFMLSRNRSTCGVRPYIRATCNPDCDSWVAELISWWIDQDTGLPIPSRSGVVRWFVRINESLIWADTRDELLQRYPDIPPKSLTFIGAKLTDNPALMSADPGYLANLMALPTVERERLLCGNWRVKQEGAIFKPGWLRHYTRRGEHYILGNRPVDPRSCRRFQTVDLACSEKQTADFMVISTWDDDRSGQLVLRDRVRDRVDGSRILPLLLAAWNLHRPLFVGIESIGFQLTVIQDAQKKGIPVRQLFPHKDKVTRSIPAQVRCEGGTVWFPYGADRFLDFESELLSFPLGEHDDMVDTLSYAAMEMDRLYQMASSSRPLAGNGMGAL